jgi:two-component system, cell cycle response regulator DivK
MKLRQMAHIEPCVPCQRCTKRSEVIGSRQDRPLVSRLLQFNGTISKEAQAIDTPTSDTAAKPLKKVLVADDKPTGRELVRTVLENGGYEVFEASDGIEALDIANRIQPDLIILDLHMPGLDGFGVIKELRLTANFVATPVVALTASAMQGDKQRALSAGFTGYITKPVSLRALRAEVERLLA